MFYFYKNPRNNNNFEFFSSHFLLKDAITEFYKTWLKLKEKSKLYVINSENKENSDFFLNILTLGETNKLEVSLYSTNRVLFCIEFYNYQENNSSTSNTKPTMSKSEKPKYEKKSPLPAVTKKTEVIIFDEEDNLHSFDDFTEAANFAASTDKELLIFATLTKETLLKMQEAREVAHKMILRHFGAIM